MKSCANRTSRRGWLRWCRFWGPPGSLRRSCGGFVLRRREEAECISATLPAEPRRRNHRFASVGECIRATLPAEPRKLLINPCAGERVGGLCRGRRTSREADLVDETMSDEESATIRVRAEQRSLAATRGEHSTWPISMASHRRSNREVAKLTPVFISSARHRSTADRPSLHAPKS